MNGFAKMVVYFGGIKHTLTCSFDALDAPVVAPLVGLIIPPTMTDLVVPGVDAGGSPTGAAPRSLKASIYIV